MTATQYIQKEVNKGMVKSGKMARIEARREHDRKVAQRLGFATAQDAFNVMGQEFIKIVRQTAPSING